MKTISTYFISLRPHQWLKNFLIFVPFLAAHNINTEIIKLAVIIFFSFSLMASSVYIFNDIIDLKADRAHPLKKYRVFASGKISLSNGKIFAVLLFLLSIIIAIKVNNLLIIILLLYFLISNFYSMVLKKIIILDICTLAILYTSRIVTGGIVLEIDLSVWLLAFSLFFFFSLAAIKRQAELVDLIKRKKLKPANRGYKTTDLPVISISALGAGYISVLVMALYVNSPEISQLYSQPQALWGICMVLLFWLTKISLITQRGEMHYDPIIYAVKDITSQICFILILFFISIGILF